MRLSFPITHVTIGSRTLRRTTVPQHVSRLFRGKLSARPCAAILLLVAYAVMPHAGPTLLAQSDAVPPAVTVLSPPNSAVNVTTDVRITASFTESVQPASIAFSLRDSSNV